VICSIETGWIALLLFTLALINSIGRVTLSVAADPITEEFGLFSIKLEYSSFLWAYFLCLIPMGYWSVSSHHEGRRC
jgi:ACS family glucarate transporter-like MFS transporter